MISQFVFRILWSLYWGIKIENIRSLTLSHSKSLSYLLGDLTFFHSMFSVSFTMDLFAACVRQWIFFQQFEQFRNNLFHLFHTRKKNCLMCVSIVLNWVQLDSPHTFPPFTSHLLSSLSCSRFFARLLARSIIVKRKCGWQRAHSSKWIASNGVSCCEGWAF